MSERLKWFAMVIAAASLAGFTPGAGAQAQTLLETARQNKTVVVGLANEKPYAYVDTDGQVTGAMVEVLRAALLPMGIDKIEANVNEFSALVPGVAARRFDIIGAGMYISPKRCQAVAFTNPITQIAVVLATKTGNPANIHSLEDIAKSDTLTVGAQLGTAQVDDLKRAGIPDNRIVLFSRNSEGIAGLRAGRVDAIYYPSIELNELIKTLGGNEVERANPFAIAKDKDGRPQLNYQAFGFNKEDGDFVAAVNRSLDELRASGKLKDILTPFGFTEQDIAPADVRAEHICAGG